MVTAARTARASHLERLRGRGGLAGAATLRPVPSPVLAELWRCVRPRAELHTRKPCRGNCPSGGERPCEQRKTPRPQLSSGCPALREPLCFKGSL